MRGAICPSCSAEGYCDDWRCCVLVRKGVEIDLVPLVGHGVSGDEWGAVLRSSEVHAIPNAGVVGGEGVSLTCAIELKPDGIDADASVHSLSIGISLLRWSLSAVI